SRWYDSEVGRFINQDDVSVLQESKSIINGLNLYSYCNNNPVMHVDHSGRAFWDSIGNWFNSFGFLISKNWQLFTGLSIIVALGIATIYTGGALGDVLVAAVGGGIGSFLSTAVNGDWSILEIIF
ncbi:MAG: hypothetical protein LBU60_04515, partial [Clostridiales bacterium]|nr:hypothetical protein [Clostridiales bacterium]